MVWFGLGCGLMAQLLHQYFDCISLWIHFSLFLPFHFLQLLAHASPICLQEPCRSWKIVCLETLGAIWPTWSSMAFHLCDNPGSQKNKGAVSFALGSKNHTPSPEWLTNKPLLSATCAYPFKWHYWFASSNHTETSHSFTNFSSYQVATFLPILNNSTT